MYLLPSYSSRYVCVVCAKMLDIVVIASINLISRAGTVHKDFCICGIEARMLDAGFSISQQPLEIKIMFSIPLQKMISKMFKLKPE